MIVHDKKLHLILSTDLIFLSEQLKLKLQDAYNMNLYISTQLALEGSMIDIYMNLMKFSNHVLISEPQTADDLFINFNVY